MAATQRELFSFLTQPVRTPRPSAPVLPTSDAQLACNNCKSQFDRHTRRPKLISCLHVVCQVCATANVYCCGSRCGTEYQDAFSVLQQLPLISSTDQCHCGQCLSEERATAFCVECEEPLCSIHSQAHARSRGGAGHQVIVLEGAQPCSVVPQDPTRQAVVKCSKHTTENLVYWCESHSKVICRDCAILEHRSCRTLRTPAEAQTDLQPSVQQHTKRLATHEGQLSASRDAVRRRTTEIDAAFAREKAKIAQTFDELVRVVNTRRDKLLADLSAEHTRRKLAITSQETSLSTAIADTKRATERTQQLTASPAVRTLQQWPLVSGYCTKLVATSGSRSPSVNAVVEFRAVSGGATPQAPAPGAAAPAGGAVAPVDVVQAISNVGNLAFK